MEPIPETSEAASEFGPFLSGDVDLLDQLQVMAARVQEVVPDCVGLSLAYRELGVTFTLVASDESIAALDGLQYLDGGPCVAAVDTAQVVEFTGDELLGEQAWHLFVRGTAARGVASTLTLPLMAEGSVVGSVNLYAASPDSFAGKHDEVAAIFGAWATGAVTNADLSFVTRRTAEEAPRILAEDMRLHVAIGILVASMDISVETAQDKLRDAAAKAGVSPVTMADLVIEQNTFQDTHNRNGDSDHRD
jgi:GAF domain-containing protein